MAAAETLAQAGDGTFSAREIHAELGRAGTPWSWPWVRRMVTRRLAGREGSLQPVFVEVTPGRYRFRTEEPVRSGPLEPAAPSFAPAQSGRTVPPSGCRAAILEAGAALADRDPEGLFRLNDLLAELRALGHGYVKATVQENLCRMTGRQFAGHRSFDDLERVALGVYRLRPATG